jgi:Fur family peroxide stress response transcriptional regulator
MPSDITQAAGGDQAGEFLAALKQAGLRLTPQRSAICRSLAQDRTHPTAQALYERMRRDFPNISLATIYNTLDTLSATGLIHDLGTAGDNAVHYDADSSPHVNVICTRCHRIDDYPAAALTGMADRIARQSGYDLRGARVAYYGLCPKCRRADKTGKSA